MKGTLFIVATPIGHLDDITHRALKVLRDADVIAAEDTRHSLKLLSHYGIQKQLVSYWGEKEKSRAEAVIERLRGGQNVALISDAGTPGISDPGMVLIRRAIEEEIRVVTVPGPTALIAALTLSGFDTSRFVFQGFLPPRPAARKKAAADLALEHGTIVLYEAPHRIVAALEDLGGAFGPRNAMVVREITKIFEEVFRGPLDELASRVSASTIAGEYVIVIEGRGEQSEGSIDAALLEMTGLMKKGLGRKEAAKRIGEQYGISKKILYDRSLGQ